MSYLCKCGREFEKSQSLNSHQRWCNSCRDNVNRTTFNGKVPNHKGKTYEEAFGGDKAKEYKQKLSDSGKTAVRSSYSEKARNGFSISASNRTYRHVKWFEVGGIKVQGSWEKNVCEKLVDLGYTLKRHPIQFAKIRRYTPDVFIEELGIYIEVKGWLKDRDVKKYLEFFSEHPSIDIRILRGKDYIKFIGGVLDVIDLPLLQNACKLHEEYNEVQ